MARRAANKTDRCLTGKDSPVKSTKYDETEVPGGPLIRRPRALCGSGNIGYDWIPLQNSSDITASSSFTLLCIACHGDLQTDKKKSILKNKS